MPRRLVLWILGREVLTLELGGHDEDTEAEDGEDEALPTLPATGDLYPARPVDARMGFVLPANDWLLPDDGED